MSTQRSTAVVAAGGRRDRGRAHRRGRARRLAARGSGIAVPGFVDLQVNGFAGVDFAATDDGRLPTRRRGAARTGVTAFRRRCPRRPGRIRRCAGRGAAPTTLGPRCSACTSRARSSRRAARRASRRRPAATPIRRARPPLLDAGPVALGDAGARAAGALDLVDHCAHAASSSPRALGRDRRAGARGVRPRRRMVTHLFNAMRPLSAPRAGSSAPRSSART